MDYKGWNEFEIGSVLTPFAEDGQTQVTKHNDARDYLPDSSFQISVSHWRVEKPIHNVSTCINCFNCWVYCPDSAILARNDKLSGVDYEHCKGCGVCVEVCPTNPKSLLMFSNYESSEEALSKWPAKEPKNKKDN